MNFIEAIQSAFTNLNNYSGRATRSEFWYWQLVIFIGNCLIGIMHSHGLMGGLAHASPVQVSTGPVLGVTMVFPSVAVGVRRLNDSNHSGWWFLLVAIPIVGWIYLVMLFLKPGDDGDNDYGPDMRA